MEQRENIEKVAQLILEEMGVTDGVTPQIISIFRQYPYRTLVTPIVRRMRKNGKTREQVAIQLGITVETVRWIESKD